MTFARNLHIETRILAGDDDAGTLVDFARRNDITQIFLVRPPDRRPEETSNPYRGFVYIKEVLLS